MKEEICCCSWKLRANCGKARTKEKEKAADSFLLGKKKKFFSLVYILQHIYGSEEKRKRIFITLHTLFDCKKRPQYLKKWVGLVPLCECLKVKTPFLIKSIKIFEHFQK